LLDVAQRLQRAWPDDLPRCGIETAVSGLVDASVEIDDAAEALTHYADAVALTADGLLAKRRVVTW
jgi:hypothetical protein